MITAVIHSLMPKGVEHISARLKAIERERDSFVDAERR